MAEGNKFLLKIITPDRVFYEGEASMVEFNTTEGEIGVYKEHVPTTVIIAPGVLTITEDGEKRLAALHSGFVEIRKEKVTVMAEVIEWSGEIDVERAREAMERARQRLTSNAPGTDMARAEVALRRAMARLQATKR